MPETLSECPVCQSKKHAHFISTPAQMHSDLKPYSFYRCQDCALVFLNPRVSEHELKAFYTEHYLPYRGSSAWGKYAKFVEGSQEKLDERRVKLLSSHMDLKEESTVLDIGCGKPSFLSLLHKTFRCNAKGLDFSDEAWNSSPDFDQLDLQKGEITQLTKEVQPDAITMWHYLEHDYAPKKHLEHLHSIVKRGTTLLIEVPNFESESRKIYGEHWAGWHTPRHTQLFSPSNISLLLENSGWKVKKVQSSGSMDPFVLYWMSEMNKKKMAWNGNLENEFWPFVASSIQFKLRHWNKKNSSLGVMTIVAEAR